MSIPVLILGGSGSGKSASLRNFNPEEVLLIQSIRKPLPFKSSYSILSSENPNGNTLVTDSSEKICSYMRRTKKNIIIIDDFQYIMANEYMRRSQEKGFDKFTEIGKHAFDVLSLSSQLSENKRVYILSHTDRDEFGNVKCKTIGKLLDEKITIEGLFTLVLKTKIEDGNFYFSTINDGFDTVKSPMGLFEDRLIKNDLNFVDQSIKEYYSIGE